jgi:hypothetical protein
MVGLLVASAVMAGCSPAGPSDEARQALGYACEIAGPSIVEAGDLLEAKSDWEQVDSAALIRLVYAHQDALVTAATTTAPFEDESSLPTTFELAAWTLPRMALWFAQEPLGAPYPSEDWLDVVDLWPGLAQAVARDCPLYPPIG